MGFQQNGFKPFLHGAIIERSSLFFLFTVIVDDRKGRWKKLCRPPTHGVSQYRFTAPRVQWACSTVTIKPIWSLKWSGQVCSFRNGPVENLIEFHRVWSYGCGVRYSTCWGFCRKKKVLVFLYITKNDPLCFFSVFSIHVLVPGTTRPRRLLSHWPLPV